jgi:hypothetical protein
MVYQKAKNLDRSQTELLTVYLRAWQKVSAMAWRTVYRSDCCQAALQRASRKVLRRVCPRASPMVSVMEWPTESQMVCR